MIVIHFFVSIFFFNFFLNFFPFTEDDMALAPRLQPAKRSLQSAMLRDQLGHKLEARPQPSDLVDTNILPRDVSVPQSQV